MPEGDRFEREFRPGWVGAARYIREGSASIEETGDKLTKTLAERLRASGGVPGFDEMLEIITGRDHSNLLDSFDALDDIVKVQDGSLHTKVAAGVAKSALVQRPPDFTRDENALARSFAENICVAILEHSLFTKAENHLIQEGKFSSREEFRAYQERQLQQMMPDIRKVAERLAIDPDANGLRAPNRRAPIESTSVLLEEDLM